ncbi:MAG: hypothetical protein QMD22_11635, partial [archaeon]|nr:hypothetical protein [archaeon]
SLSGKPLQGLRGRGAEPHTRERGQSPRLRGRGAEPHMLKEKIIVFFYLLLALWNFAVTNFSFFDFFYAVLFSQLHRTFFVNFTNGAVKSNILRGKPTEKFFISI